MDATEHLAEGLQDTPENREDWCALAEREVSRGRLGKAVEVVRRAIDSCGVDAGLLSVLGRAHELSDCCLEAGSAYEQALALERQRPDALLGLARTLVAQDRKDEARRLVDEMLAIDPDAAEAYAVLAAIHLADEEPEEALTLAEKGIGLQSDVPSLHRHRGAALHLLNRLEEAQRAFEDAVRLDPDNASLRLDAGSNLLKQSDYDKAQISLERAIALRPDYVAAYVELGAVFEAEEWYQDAIDIYQRAIRLAPREPEPHRCLGTLLGWFERYDEAQVCWENVLRILPEDVSALEHLGDVYREKGFLDDAISLYRKAAERGGESATHFLSALLGVTTAAPPSGYVESLFDGYSNEFEEHLTETLLYNVPRLLCDLLVETAGANPPHFHHGLDLGCGTGLAGPALIPIVDKLEGVDVSSEMMRLAEDKHVYASLHHGDLVEFLNGCECRFDLFFAADVLVYLGDLEGVFSAVADRAAPGAYFALSLEHTDAETFKLLKSGRYAHPETYIRGLASKHSWEVKAWRQEDIRQEDQEWLKGLLFVLRRR